ncbi:hypothetical protein AB0C02_00370 [Micromonospora sp. NPDC048999]|uniref:hypothetical protein n=1 Tax=Micromonospora sp. NPDC048999 TaxID=3155391 RepID=UPI0033F8EBB9
MQVARFVFLTMLPSTGTQGDPPGGVVWMLVSPNNRTLGRGLSLHRSYADCRDAVLRLREGGPRCRPVLSNVEATGQWTWRVELDGRQVAMASRSYLRMRECSYNLERFLAVLPAAEVVPGTRAVRRGRWHGDPGAGEGETRPGASLRQVAR